MPLHGASVAENGAATRQAAPGVRYEANGWSHARHIKARPGFPHALMRHIGERQGTPRACCGDVISSARVSARATSNRLGSCLPARTEGCSTGRPQTTNPRPAGDRGLFLLPVFIHVIYVREAFILFYPTRPAIAYLLPHLAPYLLGRP